MNPDRPRHPADDRAAAGDADSAAPEQSPLGAAVQTLPDGSVVIPVVEEELLVGTRRRVRERVIVRKRQEVREEVVEESVRRERVELESDDGVELEGDVARAATGATLRPEEPLQVLLTVEDIPTLRGVRVFTADDEELGRVGDVEYDARTREVRSVGVAADRIGIRRLDVPTDNAVLRSDRLQLAYTRAELDALGDAGAGSSDAPAADESARRRTDAAVVRHEEEPRVGTRVTDVGNIHVRKEVEEYPATKAVRVVVEEVGDVERVPPSENESGEVEVLDDGSISIPIFEDDVVVTKQPVVRERIVIKKEVDTDRYTLQTRLRRERVDVDAPDR